jgi:hypothetical protein
MLEQFLKRRQKRSAVIEERKVPLTLIKDALTAYLQPFHSVDGKEIIDVDIPSLTTGLEIKIYWR